MASIDGTSGNDTLPGTGADDTITGADLDDSITGGGGADTIFGDFGPSPFAAESGLNATPLFLQSGNTQNLAVDGTSVEYTDIATLDDGTPVLGRLTIVSTSDPGLPVNLAGNPGAEIALNGPGGAAFEGETATLRLEFFNQVTGEPVALDTTATFGDVDQSPSGTESVSIGKQFVSGFTTSATSDLTLADDPASVTASGSSPTTAPDQDAWFSADIAAQTGFEFTLTARSGGTGYTLNGETIDDPVSTIAVTPGDDTIDGGDGADLLDGGPGDDSIIGGEGEDTLIGSSGNDTLEGGDGADTLNGGTGDDSILGGSGADSIIGVNAGDSVFGGEAGDDNDVLDLTGSLPPGGSYILTNLTPDSDGNGQDGQVEYFDSNGDPAGILTFSNIETIVPCFTPGCQIVTDRGLRPVESLAEGDRVVTRDNGLQTIRWAGHKTVSAADLAGQRDLRPILIRAGALGDNLPDRDMMVSPNHRMLVGRARTALYFEDHEVLVAAKHLVDGQKIQVVQPQGLTYHHILFDHHQVVMSDGCWSESFQPGELSLNGLDDDQRGEVLQLFPQLGDPQRGNVYPAARRSLKKHEAGLLVG